MKHFLAGKSFNYKNSRFLFIKYLESGGNHLFWETYSKAF